MLLSRKRLLSFFAFVVFFGALAWGQSTPPTKSSPTKYGYWLNQDVRFIIMPEERAAFLKVRTDDERRDFVDFFWLRRDPTPDTLENEYKDEYYRRMVYANEQFAAGVTPGWASDRGRIYTEYGPPDKVESSGVENSDEKFPVETWRYRYLEGIGRDVTFEFVDTCRCGDYRLTIDKSEKDAPLYLPQHSPHAGGTEAIDGPLHQVQLLRPPQPKFKDLEELITHKINLNSVPLAVRTDFLKVTSFSDLVPITIGVKYRDLTFTNKDGVATATLHIFGRVTTPTNWVSDTFEDTLQVQMPADLLPKSLNESVTYWKVLPLPEGNYPLAIAVKDVAGDRVGTAYSDFAAPEYKSGHLGTSSLMLLKHMSPDTQVTGQNSLGATKIWPQPLSVFPRNSELNLWMQVYGLGIDASTQHPNVRIEYEIANARGKTVFGVAETPQAPGRQMTLKRTVPLASLGPGKYSVIVRVSDKVMDQRAVASAGFVVQ